MESTLSVSTETIHFLNDKFTIRALLARPTDRPEKLPAIILLHEWWGLTDHTVQVARRFAQEGYVVAAIDLYSRQGYKVTADPAEATKLMAALSTQGALRDINALTQQLKSLPYVDGRRLGVVGFSMGAGVALIMAQHNSDFKAAVAFYGKTPPIENVDSFIVPVQFHDAGKDGWVTRKEVDGLREGMLQNGKPIEVIRYPEADHAFFNSTRPEAYRQDDAAAAWQATLRFLKAHLW